MTKKIHKRKKISLSSKFRILIIFIIFSIINFTLGYNCYGNVKQIFILNQQKEKLDMKKVTLLEEKEVLESDIKKLGDPDYIAKYVREKYLYSKDGELIIRLDED